MKNVFRIAVLCLTLAVLSVLGACVGAETSAETTASDPTVSTSDPAVSTEEVKIADVVVDGKTDYVIVYDDSNSVITSAVKSYASKMKIAFGVTLTHKGVSTVTEPYEHEIIVGDIADKRPIVNKVKANCAKSDFAISVQNGDVVFYATDDLNYKYLFSALFTEEGLMPVDGKLTYTAENDYYYHTSDLKELSYMEYLVSGSSTFNKQILRSFFTEHETTKENGEKLVYRLYVPTNYDPEKEYPLVVVLHGAGERGTDNTAQFGNLVYDLFNHDTSPFHDAIVILPQCPTGNQWVDTPWANGNYSTSSVKESDELKAVMKVLEGVQTTYSVDDSRIYAMGLSMGGFGTWDLLMRHGDVFAAGIPICGGADVSKAADLAKIPIRTFHSKGDGIVPASGTQAMAAAINACNPVDFKYTEFDSNDHNAWTAVGQDLETLNWLFAQSKTK